MTTNFATEVDFKSPVWNRDSWARIHGDVNPEKEKVTSCSGVVLGARPGEKVRELCGFETFLVTRLLPLENGDYRRLNKEVIYYRDPFSGQLINEWTNPWTGEQVRVVDVVNDPFNYTISTHLIIAPEDFGGDAKAEPRKIPLMFPWKEVDSETLVLTTDMHLYYPNALDPAKWVRESSGPMVRVSEMMRYFVKRADLENPDLTSVKHYGTWNRVTPWLPWMLLGDMPGECLYVGTMTCSDSLDIVPQDTIDYTQANYPHMLHAPTEDYGPSISSLEYYAKEQTPAPPLEES